MAFFFFSSWLSALLVVFLSLVVITQAAGSAGVTVSPANNTDALNQQFGAVRFLMTDTNVSNAVVVNLVPLTSALANVTWPFFQAFDIQGQLYQTSQPNTISPSPKNIVLISCDPPAYTGYLDVADIVSGVVSAPSPGPAAVVLYSQQSDYCNYTVTDPAINYSYVFTALKSVDEQLFLDHLPGPNQTLTAQIAGDMSTSGSVQGFSSSNSTSGAGQGASSSSTTAVAMVILYVITGIVTALFLGIIITGAIRAHRNPERYGPRNVRGRPRQSRAKGIARAMLETIPIVKFGDDREEGLHAAKGDLELASRNDEASTHTSETLHEEGLTDHANAHSTPNAASTIDATAPHTSHETTDSVEAANTDVTAAVAAAAAAANRDMADSGNNNCPICTDDFIKGQDVRLLPCGHQFHPECIDPWLINVSGTCPLCRIDLNPAASEAAEEGNSADTNEGGEAVESSEAIAAGAGAGADGTTNNAMTNSSSSNISNRHSRSLAGYLSEVRRARNAPVEQRLEALRRLRQSRPQRQNGNGTDDTTTPEDPQGGPRRLATRLRDRFRIRTRQHGSE